MLSRRTKTMRNMRITAAFIIVGILEIASPVAAADSRVRRRTEAVKGNGIFGRNRLTGNNQAGPQPTSVVSNARPRRLSNGTIYHHGQVPSGVTLPEMEQGTIYHFSVEEGNLGKKGVKGSRSEKTAPPVIHPESGKGVKEKPVYVTDEDDGEDTMYSPDDYEYSAPGKMHKAKARNPTGYGEMTYPPEENSGSYDDEDEDYYEETPKGISYKKGYYPKKYQSDKLPSSSPKELPGAKAQKYYSDEADRTPKDNPPGPMSRPGGDAKDAAPKDTETNDGDLAIVSDGTTSTGGGGGEDAAPDLEQDPVIRTLPVAAFHYTTISTDAASEGEVEELAAATAEVFTALFQAAFPELYELKLIEYGALTERLVKYKVELYFHDPSEAPTDAQVKAAAVAGFADQAIYNKAYLQRLGQMESSVYSTTSSVVFIADDQGVMEAQTASSDSSEDDGNAKIYAPIVSGLAIFAFLGSMIYARGKLQPLAGEEHEALKSKSHSQTQEDATDDGGTMMSDFRTVAFSEDGIEDTIPRTSKKAASDLGSALDLELQQVMARMNEFEEVSLDDGDESQSSASSTSNLTDYGKHPESCESPSDIMSSINDEASLVDEEVAHATMKAENKKLAVPNNWKWSSSPAVSTEAEKEEQRKTPPTTTPSHEENNDTPSDQHSTESSTPFKELEAHEDGMIEVVYNEPAPSKSDQAEPSEEPGAMKQQQNQPTTTKTIQHVLASEAAAVFRKAEMKAKPTIDEKQSNRFDKKEEYSKPEWMNKKLRATGSTNKFETQSRSSSCASNVILSHASRSTVTTPCSIGTETDSNVKDCSFRSNTTIKDNPKPAWITMKLRPTSPKTDNIQRDQPVSTSTENTGVDEALQPMTDDAEHYDYDAALMQGSLKTSDLESIEDSIDDDGAPMDRVEVKFEPAWMRKRPVSPVPVHQEPQAVEEDKHPQPDTSALPEWMRKFHTMGLQKEDD